MTNQICFYNLQSKAFPKISSSIILPRASTSSVSFNFLHQNFLHVSYLPICATCPAHLILVPLIIVIIRGEDHKLRISSLCTSLQPPASWSNYSLQDSPNTIDLCSTPRCETAISIWFRKWIGSGLSLTR